MSLPKPPVKIELPAYGWEPREDQIALWDYLENGGLRAVEVAHRRFGKDDVSLHSTAIKAHERVGNYWHMLPQFNQCRKAIWEAVNPRTGKKRIDEAFPKELRSKTRDTDMFIEFKFGSSWQLVGSDNYNALVGSPPVGIVFSEYALSDPQSWAYLSPILEENGGWAIFISTSRGNNHLKLILDHAKRTPGWFGQVLTAADTSVFTTAQLQQIKSDLIGQYGDELGTAMFMQEYFCSFEGAVPGAYWAKQMAKARAEGRITKVPHQPGQEVDTFWDLGIDDSMSIWFIQQIGRSFHCIDYYENTGYGLEHYAKELKSKPYLYGNHIMPHDAQQREMTNSEIALSRKQVAEDLGIKPISVVKRSKSMDIIVQVHIPAVRNILSQCWFDEVKCSKGISALETYRAEYDDEKKKLGNRPVHDWSSHASSAFITFAVGSKEMGRSIGGEAIVPGSTSRASGWAR
jgi:hypothetical protein